MSTPSAYGRAHRRALCALALAVAAVLPATASAATPSPEDVRACVELNLPRYTNPGSAVAAQYADAETSCKAALTDGSVSVQFEPGSGGGTPPATTTRDGGAAAPAGDGPDEPDSGGGTTTTAPSTAAPAGAPASGARGQATTTPKPPSAGSKRLVAGAIASADAGPGSPLPSSLSGVSAWLLVLIGGAAVLIAGAASIAVRRRLH